MNRLGIYAGLVLAVAMLGAVGCNDEMKKELDALRAENAQLKAANEENQKGLAEARSQATVLEKQIDTKETELVAAKGEIARLKSAKPVTPPVSVNPAKPPVEPAKPDNEPGQIMLATLGSDVLFQAGHAALTDKGKAEIKKLAGEIKTKYAAGTLRVYGYTDSDPIVKTAKLWTDNLDLSANRAMAVTRELIDLGIAKDRIETVAMGDTHPLSKTNKAENRRVEVALVKK